ncbi:MAG: ABC transporter permease, partial [Pyrinomonadaceae bacterium]
MNSLVFSNMLHRPARTVVSIIGIGMGILLIVFTVGLANGSLRERAQREAKVNAEIMLRASGSIGLSGSEALRIPVSIVSDIEKVDGVQTAVPIAQNTIEVKDGLTGLRLVDGVDLAAYAPLVGLEIVKGRAFT